MKLDLILENTRMAYSMGLLEEAEGMTEKEILGGKIMINESIMDIRNLLVEEGVMEGAKSMLEEAWTAELTLVEEANAAYDKYFAKTLKDCGYKDVDSIPADKKDDFFEKVDKGWNSASEAGEDGKV